MNQKCRGGGRKVSGIQTPLKCQSSLCSHGTAPSFTTLVSDALLNKFSQCDLGLQLVNLHSLGMSPPVGESQYCAPFPGTDIPSDIFLPQRGMERCQTRISASATEAQISLRTFKCGVGKEALDSLLAHRPRLPLSSNS